MSKPVQLAPATADVVTSDPGKLLCPALQFVALYLLVIVIMAMVNSAHAEGYVYKLPVPFNFGWRNICGNCGVLSSGHGFATAQEACTASESAPELQGVSWLWPTTATGGPDLFYCKASYGYTFTVAVKERISCPANSTGVPPSWNSLCICNTGYAPDSTRTSCIAACPAHASGTPCVCDAGYKFDAAGTSCVPACTFTKVADVTGSVAKLYEDGTYSDTKPDLVHLTLATQTGLACIQQKVAALNCYMTPQPTSGYRPTAYQTHILEVYDKWQLIKDDNTPACAETKAAIYAEWLNHRPFARRPGVTSNHSQVDALGNPAGNAVDISYVPDNVNDSADAVACQCNMYRPLINMPDPTKNDPVHYQPRTCPR
ncbi:MAG: hypothetical protein NUV63_05950 [Gallionella sp.]|nr:hypothetical protein [Gallionella sp.]